MAFLFIFNSTKPSSMYHKFAGFIFFFFVLASCDLTKRNYQKIENEKSILYYKLKNRSIPLETRINLSDSLYSTISSTSVDSLDLAILLQKSLLHFEEGAYNDFLYYNQLITKKPFQNLNTHHSFKGKAYFNIGYYYDDLSRKIDSSYHYYELSKNTFLKIKDSSEAGSIYMNMAMLLRTKNDFFGAKELLTASLKLLDTVKDRRFLASVYDQLGVNNRKLLNYQDAILYHKKAINVSISEEDILSYKNNLSVVYREQKEYKKAIDLLNEVISSPLLKKSTFKYARILHNLTYSRWKNNENRVLIDFLKALQIRKKKNDYRGLLASYTDLGEYYTYHDINRAKLYLDSLILLSKQLKTPKAEIDALSFLMDISPKDIGYKERYIFLKDSLYRQELKVKTQFAKMRYDDQLEKIKIQQLEIESNQRRVEISEQKNQKIVILSLSGFLILSGASFFFFLKQKHRKERLQEIYRTEKRISKQLHDGLANDVFSLMTQLEHIAKKKNKVFLDGLESIYRRTRDISHENNAIITGMEYINELRSLLKTYQGKDVSIVAKGIDSIAWHKLKEHICVAIHRTLKELMVNMKKHSEASLVVLDFKKDQKKIIIRYKDNGIGCKSDQKYGMGLQNTVSRIQSCNGTFIFKAEPRKGVKIDISIPC